MWDFPLVNVASAMKASGGTIQAVRVVGGGGGGDPAAADGGRSRGDRQAAQQRHGGNGGRLAVEGAQPLRYNGYKIPLMRNLVARALRGTSTASTT